MVKSSDLSWIVVSNLDATLKFFTETLGLKELNVSKEYGWAELGGAEGGATIGIAEESPMMEEIKAGGNAIITLTVEDLDETSEVYVSKGVKLVGEVVEVPGHVKMQLFNDLDGNLLQLVQRLD